MQWPSTINQWLGIAGTILVSLEIFVRKDWLDRLNDFCETFRLTLERKLIKILRSLTNKYIAFIAVIAPLLIILFTNIFCVPPHLCDANFKILFFMGICLTIMLLLPTLLILIIIMIWFFKILAISKAKKGITALLGVFLLILSYVW
jgi:hypothetical protein